MVTHFSKSAKMKTRKVHWEIFRQQVFLCPLCPDKSYGMQHKDYIWFLLHRKTLKSIFVCIYQYKAYRHYWIFLKTSHLVHSCCLYLQQSHPTSTHSDHCSHCFKSTFFREAFNGRPLNVQEKSKIFTLIHSICKANIRRDEILPF